MLTFQVRKNYKVYLTKMVIKYFDDMIYMQVIISDPNPSSKIHEKYCCADSVDYIITALAKFNLDIPYLLTRF